MIGSHDTDGRSGQEDVRTAASSEAGHGPAPAWRWAMFAATIVAVLVLSSSPLWGAALALPLLAGAIAPRLFPPLAIERWVRRGYLLLADGLLVGLALLGTVRPHPYVFVGLFGLVALSVLVGDRRKSSLTAVALLAMAVATTLSVPGLAPGLEPANVLYLAVMLTGAFHFGLLGELVRAKRFTPRGDGAELWAMLDITDTITSTLDVGQVMHSVVERVGDLVDTHSCTVLLSQPSSPGCFVVASKGHPEADMLRIDLADYPEVRHALQTHQPVVIDDIEQHPLVEPVRDLLREKGYRSLLVLPLMFGREVMGALFLRSTQPGQFDADAQRFCKVAAGVSANALKNALLYRDVKETGEKLRRVLDATPDMIVATDLAGDVTEFNRGAESMTGVAAAHATGRPLAELLGGNRPEERAPEAQEVVFCREDGDEVEVSLVSAPLHGSAGEPVGAVWIGRDVTKLRRVERRLAQAERLSSLGEIVAGVAHELNNPLSGVVGYAELLRSNAGDPEQIQDLQRIVESAMRCQRIVLKLLSFARKQPPEKRFNDLNDCVSKVVDLKLYHLQSSEIETVLELDPALPGTCFDFQQIEQVVLNLLNNAEQAIGAIRRSGKIVMRTGSEAGRIFVEVTDDGPGIPEDVRERVFDPFFSTKELGKGTGLGLSVSYGIVQEHDGEIEVHAASGGGTTFRVSLPVIEGEEHLVGPPLAEIGREASRLRGCRILVADDEPTVLELFARLLRQEGAEVTAARDGSEAWDRLGECEFDLVIADLRMPNLSGQELYERVAEERPELMRRFVFATGDLVRPETTSFLEGLPNRILTKPLELETVRRVLSQAIEAA